MSREILSIRKTVGIAGQFTMTVKLADSEGFTYFHGSEYGTPGPIVAEFGSMQTFVSSPERFGNKLDAEWVKRYYA